MINWNLKAERELWRAICAPKRWFNKRGEVDTHPDSLWWFTHIAWGAEWYFRTSHKKRWLVKRVHGPYLRWLQNLRLGWMDARARGQGERVFVATIMPRNCGKSVTTTKCCTLWSHLDNPDMASVLAAEDKELSFALLSAMKKILDGSDPNGWFTWLYGNWKTEDRDWLKGTIVHGYRRATALSEPSIAAASVETGMTGYHPDDCTWDDPLSANKLRESGGHLSSAHVAFDATYYALATDGWLGMVLTRYEDDDIAGRHLIDEGVAEWCGMPPPNKSYFEKIPEGKGRWHVWFMQIEDENGHPVIPEIMNKKEIEYSKKRNPIDHACQYQNDPQSGEHVQITEEQINSYRIDRSKLRDIPIAYATIHLDTAFKTEETIAKGDDNAIVVFLHDARPNGVVYFDGATVSNEWRDEHFMTALVATLQRLRRQGYHVKCITDEIEQGGKRESFKNHLIAVIRSAGLPSIPKIIQFPRQGTHKEQRIRTATGFWVDGYVRILVPVDHEGEFIDAACPGFVKLRSQLVKGRRAPHDDIADAASDVWATDIWRKPSSESFGLAREYSQTTISPGDFGLKHFIRGIMDDATLELLHKQDAERDNDGLRGSETGDFYQDEVWKGFR